MHARRRSVESTKKGARGTSLAPLVSSLAGLAPNYSSGDPDEPVRDHFQSVSTHPMTHTLEKGELICNIDPMVLVAILLNPEIRISQPILGLSRSLSSLVISHSWSDDPENHQHRRHDETAEDGFPRKPFDKF